MAPAGRAQDDAARLGCLALQSSQEKWALLDAAKASRRCYSCVETTSLPMRGHAQQL